MANARAAVGASRFHTAFRSKKSWRCGESRRKRISHPLGALHRLKKGVEGNGAGYPGMGSGHSGVVRNRPTDKKKRSIRSVNRNEKSREKNFARLFSFAAATFADPASAVLGRQTGFGGLLVQRFKLADQFVALLLQRPVGILHAQVFGPGHFSLLHAFVVPFNLLVN